MEFIIATIIAFLSSILISNLIDNALGGLVLGHMIEEEMTALQKEK